MKKRNYTAIRSGEPEARDSTRVVQLKISGSVALLQKKSGNGSGSDEEERVVVGRFKGEELW